MTTTIDRKVFHGLDPELLELFLIVAINPARGINGDRLIRALDLVFLFQTAGDHIELQHTDGTKDDVVTALGEEHLGGAFFSQLLQALTQLLGFQRITQTHATEQFRGEVRDAGEAQDFAFGEGVAGPSFIAGKSPS